MTETTTPTEGEVIENTGVDETTLPVDDGTEDSAVETGNDTEQQESTSSDSDNSTEDNNENDGLDANLAKFAKSQGFDPDNLTANEVKALKLAHNNQKAYRASIDASKPGEIDRKINEVDSSTDMTDREYTDFRLNQQVLRNNVQRYWMENPDDRQYEKEAVAILQKEKEQYGDAAQMRLIQDMPRLLREAKFAAGVYDTKKIAEKAQREERERLRKEQEGGADSLNASNSNPSGGEKDMRQWIREEYDPSNPEHRKKLDDYTRNTVR